MQSEIMVSPKRRQNDVVGGKAAEDESGRHVEGKLTCLEAFPAV